jgi:site-specific DNA-cytosine methylase
MLNQTTLQQFDTRRAAAATTEVVDLFCGCGGFSAGVFGFDDVRVALAVDNKDKYGRRVLKLHASKHPCTVHKAMKLGPKTEKRLLKYIRLHTTPSQHLHVHGSPPCQDWSALNIYKTVGRRTLTTWFIQFVKKLPSLFPDRLVTASMENVPKASNSASLVGDQNYAIICAADHGAPTTRKRLFWAFGWSIHDIKRNTKPRVSIRCALPDLCRESWNAFHSKHTFGRAPRNHDLDAPMITIVTACNGFFVELAGDRTTIISRRAPTVQELATLQGFAPGYFDRVLAKRKCSTFVTKCVGNSVSPCVAASVIGCVRKLRNVRV